MSLSSHTDEEARKLNGGNIKKHLYFSSFLPLLSTLIFYFLDLSEVVLDRAQIQDTASYSTILQLMKLLKILITI